MDDGKTKARAALFGVRAFGFEADYYSVPFSAALIMFSFAEM